MPPIGLFVVRDLMGIRYEDELKKNCYILGLILGGGGYRLIVFSIP